MTIFDVSRSKVGLLNTSFELMVVTVAEVDSTERPEYTEPERVII